MSYLDPQPRELSSPRRRPRFALFLVATGAIFAALAPPAEAGAICALRAAADHPCFDNPLHPDPDLPSYKAGDESGHEAGAPNVANDSDIEGAGTREHSHPVRALDWPRSDDDRGLVCFIYRVAYLARHGGRRPPLALRPYRGCSRWEHDFDYHNRGALLPRGGLL